MQFLIFSRRAVRVVAIGLLALLAAGLTQAAALSERSPVRMGLWWDPLRTGSGVELFAAGDAQVLVWYTYREDGRPIWYTAAGHFDAQGTWSAPLMQQRWKAGAPGEPVAVGTVKMQRLHFESISFEWTLGDAAGTQSLRPFPVSGVVPEIDHSGAFYDPKKSGYGLSLTEQGSALIAGLYFYDADGEPTWRVGDNSALGGDLTMRGFRGACPGCAPRASELFDEGSLRLELFEEHRIEAHYRPAATALWPLDGELRQLSTPASLRPADRQLAHFDDEATLRAYIDDALQIVNPPSPIIDFSPPPQSVTYSTTNVQETGVDEADLLKTDGQLVYAVARGSSGALAPRVRVAEVGDAGRMLNVLPELMLESDAQYIAHAGLYVTDADLIALHGSSPSNYGGASLWLEHWAWTDGDLSVTLFDRGNPRAPSKRWQAQLDAHLVASRRIDDTLYLVVRKTSYVEGVQYGATDPAVVQANRALIAATPTAELLPRIRVGDGDYRPLVDADDVWLPVGGALPASPEFITVVAIDLDAPDDYRTLAVAGSVAAVYVSDDRMYLATTRAQPRVDPILGYSLDGFAVTDIHEIALGDSGPTVAATGTVEGYLDREPDRAVFRFSESDGRLRVVTVGDHWGPFGHNRLTVLEPSSVTPGLLRTLSYLPNRERPAPIGKPNEQLYATRFVSERLYAVTFQRVDPLYVIDLSEPEDPFIAGEVELPGFSDYLHPVGDDLLVGIGLDAALENSSWGTFTFFRGLQFSLFDVTDASRPVVLQQEFLGKRGSATALSYSHHALSALPIAGGLRLAVPVRVHAPVSASDPPLAPEYSYPWSWSGLQRIDVVGSTPQDARLVLQSPIKTHQRTSTIDYLHADDAVHAARSVQFERGLLYVEHGRFWLADENGTLVQGPR
jgi:hypothetical protein